MLELEGFRVETGIAGLPTAVMGEAGEGGPVIAILGEFDALPGLSQVAGLPEKRELEPGGNGHACGHNLLGAASLMAASAVKDYLATHGLKGRVRYRSEEHTSELQSLMRISYAVFCLNKKKKNQTTHKH